MLILGAAGPELRQKPVGKLLMVLAPVASQGEGTVSIWDAGLGLASLSFPAYRGSKVREVLALPVEHGSEAYLKWVCAETGS